MTALVKPTNKVAIRQNASPALKMSAPDFISTMSPKLVAIAHRNCNTPALALASDLPSLVDINLVYGFEFSLGYLKLWINNLCGYLGDKFSMTKEQIDETALMIYQDNYFMNIADINVIFSRIKKGKTQNLYNSLNGVALCQIFESYREERANTAISQSENAEEVIKKHGYDRSKVTATEKQLADMYFEQKMRVAELEAQRELEALNRNYHLTNLVNKFNNNLKK